MAIFTFVLGVVLAAAGVGGLVASFDLLPTELGLLYAFSGVLAICVGAVTLAIGALIHRLGALGAMIERAQPRESWQIPGAPPITEGVASPAFEPAAPAYGEAPPVEAVAHEALPEEEEEAVNANRAGHLPTMSGIEHALAEPEATPTLVGRYSSGGANYMIFSDGSIEAETESGAFKFASMSEFKAYLAGQRGG
jgi:hypothetical protein